MNIAQIKGGICTIHPVGGFNQGIDSRFWAQFKDTIQQFNASMLIFILILTNKFMRNNKQTNATMNQTMQVKLFANCLLYTSDAADE